MKYLSLILITISSSLLAFDENVLKELQEIKSSEKPRNCSHQGVKLSIVDGKVKLTDGSNQLGKFKEYNIYEESADFILAENMNISNLDYAKNNFIPEVVIFKNAKKAYVIEGLSFKFQKFGYKENCQGPNIDNMVCRNDLYRTNLSIYKKKISLSFKEKTVREVASADFHEMVFPYNRFEFHSKNVRMGNNGQLKRTVSVIESTQVLHLLYSHQNAKHVFENCALSL